jgi:hypothetical protein
MLKEVLEDIRALASNEMASTDRDYYNAGFHDGQITYARQLCGWLNLEYRIIPEGTICVLTSVEELTIEQLAEAAVNANNEITRTTARTLLQGRCSYAAEDSGSEASVPPADAPSSCSM